jgi:hypothetical protein
MYKMPGDCTGNSAGLRIYRDTAELAGCAAPRRRVHAALLWIMLIVVLAGGGMPAAAKDPKIRHFGENRLRFASVEPSLQPNATGTGLIEFKGGKEPSSQWRATFRFAGLEPGANYAVVVKGRQGASGSPEAAAFTTLCTFEADNQGQGSCFWYFRGLARLNIVQLRTDDERGTPVLEARRRRGPGSIKTERNRFSPGGEISHHES